MSRCPSLSRPRHASTPGFPIPKVTPYLQGTIGSVLAGLKKKPNYVIDGQGHGGPPFRYHTPNRTVYELVWESRGGGVCDWIQPRVGTAAINVAKSVVGVGDYWFSLWQSLGRWVCWWCFGWCALVLVPLCNTGRSHPHRCPCSPTQWKPTRSWTFTAGYEWCPAGVGVRCAWVGGAMPDSLQPLHGRDRRRVRLGVDGTVGVQLGGVVSGGGVSSSVVVS